MKLGLEGKSAIVTGAAQGLGKSIAVALANEGARVVIADINFPKAKLVEKKIKKLSPESFAVKVDVSRLKDLDKLIAATVKRFGTIDILVNNAGICPRTEYDEITEQQWDMVMAVNLKSVFFLSRKVLAYMKKGGRGKIINLASAAGKIGGVKVSAHYSASKAAVICLTKTLALYGARFGVNVNAVSPGVIDTEMTTSLANGNITELKKMIPLGRIGTADDVAMMVLFLSSDVSNYITGEIADVNGGFVMD